MYKNFYNFNITFLIRIRLHLGHKENLLNVSLTGYLFGTRNNVHIYDLDKLWKPYRYLFHGLSEMFSKRNSFFIIGINPNLPMTLLINEFINLYKKKKRKLIGSFYISGYMDKQWIPGLFLNWKIFKEFIPYIDLKNPVAFFKKKYKFLRYFPLLHGIKNLKNNPMPDFFIFLDQNSEALLEIKKLRIPLIGLVDTNMNPSNFLYQFFGNNDSIKNIKFFFKFLKETIVDGRLKEKYQFFYYFLNKVKNKLIVYET